MLLQEITIDKKDEINRYLRRKCSKNSEFTFTNLFMWRKSYDIKYVILHDMLCIMPQHTGGPRSATFPIGFIGEDGTEGDIKPVIETLLAYLQEIGETPLIRLYDDATVEKLNQAFPGRFIITEDVNSFDYVYDVQELTALAGKRFHTKKNHVNKFKKKYDWEYQPLTAHDAEECIQLFQQWHQGKGEEVPGLEEEQEAVLELFHHWDDLDLRGGCIRVDGKMVAFSVGEPLCGTMAVIHLEHADTSYEGAFAMMNQQFLEHEWQDFVYVNREEDMGIPGMRRAKESYRPVFMVKKYVATLA
ncbi:MAG: DUF2156 domain-containing protein [Clostridia bacterium]|nr:DUF2156 domain-containing protein [Clostridia bacterium]